MLISQIPKYYNNFHLNLLGNYILIMIPKDVG